jgi:methionyl-tRNA synthetase
VSSGDSRGADGTDRIAPRRQTIQTRPARLRRFEFSRGLEAIWRLISAVDKFIVERAPWKLARSRRTAEARRHALHRRRSAAHRHRAAGPVLPQSREDLGAARHAEPIESVRFATLAWGGLQTRPEDRRSLRRFPAHRAKPAIDKMRALEDKSHRRTAVLMGKKARGPPKAGAKIAIDDFAKVDLRVGLVLSAER